MQGRQRQSWMMKAMHQKMAEEAGRVCGILNAKRLAAAKQLQLAEQSSGRGGWHARDKPYVPVGIVRG